MRKMYEKGPILAFILKGNDAIKELNNLIGAANPQRAIPGSVRGDLAVNALANLAHIPLSAEAA